MKNQEDILKTLAYLNTKSQQNLDILSIVEVIFNTYEDEFFRKVCKQLRQQISHDDSLTAQEKREARKLIKDLLEGVKNLKTKYTHLKSSIANYSWFLQKSEYQQKNQAISKSILSQLGALPPKDQFNQQKLTFNNVQNSYSDSNRNFEGVEMVEDSKEQGIHGSRSQDDSNVTREPI